MVLYGDAVRPRTHCPLTESVILSTRCPFGPNRARVAVAWFDTECSPRRSAVQLSASDCHVGQSSVWVFNISYI